MVFLLLAAVCAIAYGAFRAVDYQSEAASFFCFLVAFVSGIAFMILVAVSITNNAAFPAEMAAAESLRRDAARVDLAGSEAVYGGAAEFNMLLASNKTLNKTWWADPFVADGWDTVTAISLPESK